MWKPQVCALLLLASTLVFVRAVPVAACTTDAECDNGDTCSVPDTCMSGSCVLGGSGDANADLICDDEYVSGIDLQVTKIIVRAFPAAGPVLIRGLPCSPLPSGPGDPAGRSRSSNCWS